MKTPYIIAEIGSNCFKWENPLLNLNNAKEQIEKAALAGADAVKFQFFTSRDLWGPKCKDQGFAIAQEFYSMPRQWLPALAKKCMMQKVDFLCSAFSVTGFEAVEPYVKAHKLASPEINALDLLDYLGKSKKKTIYSLGCLKDKTWPDQFLRGNDIILECISEYPADPTHYNLFLTKMLAEHHSCRWGISDHTNVMWLAQMARALGASVFERHVDFTDAFGRQSPDAVVSCSTETFRRYVKTIRNQKVIKFDDIKNGPSGRLSARRHGKGQHMGFYRPYPEGERTQDGVGLRIQKGEE